MRAIRTAVLGLAVLALAVPADLAAQGRGKAKGHDKNKGKHEARSVDRDRDRVIVRDRSVDRDRDRVIVRDRDRDIVIFDRDADLRYETARRGNAPAFCRSGAGHPVHGRSWCLEKGFGLGARDDVFLEGDDRVIFWDGDEVVVVRDRRLDRDRSWVERALDTVLFWRD